MSDGQNESGDRFTIEEPAPYREKSGMSGCLKGCLIVAAIIMVLIVVVGVWVMRNMKGWAADVTSHVVNVVVDESDLPEQEKVEIKDQVSRLTEAFRGGELSFEEVGTVIEQIMKSPLMPSIVVAGIDRKYLQSSGLSDDEKEDGRTEINRFVTGMIEEKIGEDDFQSAMRMIAVEQPNGQWQMRDSVSDDELRELIEFLKQKSDAAEIPAEVEQVDPSDEMKRIIDEALGVAPPFEEEDSQPEFEIPLDDDAAPPDIDDRASTKEDSSPDDVIEQKGQLQ